MSLTITATGHSIVTSGSPNPQLSFVCFAWLISATLTVILSSIPQDSIDLSPVSPACLLPGLFAMAATFARILGTEKDRSNCPFFYRIGACRHGDRCSRNHLRPHFSVTLMVPHMYQPTTAVPSVPTSESAANSVRYFDSMPDAAEFIDFWEDVLDEVERYGRVDDMLVLQNAGEHMHGNTYIKFHSEQEAEAAKQRISSRYYHGRQLQPEYSPVTDFSEAVCGMFKHGFCERGDYWSAHIQPAPHPLRIAQLCTLSAHLTCAVGVSVRLQQLHARATAHQGYEEETADGGREEKEDEQTRRVARSGEGEGEEVQVAFNGGQWKRGRGGGEREQCGAESAYCCVECREGGWQRRRQEAINVHLSHAFASALHVLNCKLHWAMLSGPSETEEKQHPPALLRQTLIVHVDET